MDKIIEGNITIYEALQRIKNGKYVIPAFQRQYVWSMEQIEKLWVSILLDYPIEAALTLGFRIFWLCDKNTRTAKIYGEYRHFFFLPFWFIAIIFASGLTTHLFIFFARH